MAKNLLINKKAISKMMIVAIVVVLIVVVAVGAVVMLNQNPSDSNTATPTATPSGASPTSTPTTGGVAGASSLKYSVSLTENGVVQGTYTYQGKNAGTNSFMMRIDATDSDGAKTFLFNGATKKAWTFTNNEWTDISAYYDMQFQIWNNLWSAYNTHLAAWTGTGDYPYTDGTSTVRIYDIAVNPALADSLFEHS
jgi:hypothetical protein